MTEPLFCTIEKVRIGGEERWALLPVSQSRDLFDAKPKHKLCMVEAKFPRNVKFHRKFFALLKVVFSNQDEFLTQENMRKALLIGLGYCDAFVCLNPQGQLHIHNEAHSMAFANMDESKFTTFFNQCLDFLLQHWCRAKREDVLNEVKKFAQDPAFSAELR